LRTLFCVADDPVCNCLASRQTAVGRAIQVFAWSSYPDYLKAPAKRPDWLRVNRLLGEHRIAKDSAVGRAGSKPKWSKGGQRRTGGLTRRFDVAGVLGERVSEGVACADGRTG